MSKTYSLEEILGNVILVEFLNALGSALIILDSHKCIRFVNKEVTEITGYQKEELLNKNLADSLFALWDKEKCEMGKFLARGFCEFDALLKKKGGSDFFAHVKVTPFPNKENFQVIIINFFDITEKKVLEKKLFEASITDYLTGLYNRRFMEEALKREKALADRYSTSFSIILVDLDNFKLINDIYGHNVGDKVLVEVAKLLKNNLRYSDYGCRWGGEEFLILLSHTRLEQAKVVAEKLQKLVCKMKVPPIERISASFGLSEYKINESYEETIKRADLALYKAKAEGKNCIIAL